MPGETLWARGAEWPGVQLGEGRGRLALPGCEGSTAPRAAWRRVAQVGLWGRGSWGTVPCPCPLPSCSSAEPAAVPCEQDTVGDAGDGPGPPFLLALGSGRLRSEVLRGRGRAQQPMDVGTGCVLPALGKVPAPGSRRPFRVLRAVAHWVCWCRAIYQRPRGQRRVVADRGAAGTGGQSLGQPFSSLAVPSSEVRPSGVFGGGVPPSPIPHELSAACHARFSAGMEGRPRGHQGSSGRSSPWGGQVGGRQRGSLAVRWGWWALRPPPLTFCPAQGPPAQAQPWPSCCQCPLRAGSRPSR